MCSVCETFACPAFSVNYMEFARPNLTIHHSIQPMNADLCCSQHAIRLPIYLPIVGCRTDAW